MTVVADMVEQGQEETPLLGRARTVFRRTARDLKDSLAWLARLDATATRCYVAADQEIDKDIEDSVVGLLRAVREQCPNQELEVVIFAAPDEARGGEHEHAARPVRRD